MTATDRTSPLIPVGSPPISANDHVNGTSKLLVRAYPLTLLVDFGHVDEEFIVPARYPTAFRRKVLDLVEAGRPVAEVAAQLGVSGQTVYNWRNQDLVDRGLRPGVTTAESVELAAARRRIRDRECQLAVAKRANELLREQIDKKLREQIDKKGRFEVVATVVGHRYPVEVVCGVVGVSVSGYYCWRRRPPSVHHPMLLEVIAESHDASTTGSQVRLRFSGSLPRVGLCHAGSCFRGAILKGCPDG